MKKSFVLILSRVEHLALMILMQLLQRPANSDALRPIELTKRTSVILKSQEAAALVHADSALRIPHIPKAPPARASLLRYLFWISANSRSAPSDAQPIRRRKRL